MKSHSCLRALLLALIPAFALSWSAAAQNAPSVQLVDPQAAARKPAAAASRALLPDVFSGWQKGNGRAGKDAAQADPAHAALMQEYGFSDYEQAAYRREGRSIEVKAARFADAGGAYGAFTFYKQPEMLVEKIGDQAAASNQLVLFYRGNIFVEARLDQVTAMSAAELRELAEALPPATGPARNLPVLPSYLPRESYVKNSAKYVVGATGMGLIGTPLPVELVSFRDGAEVATGKYATDGGTGELVLISYPTPQIAGEREHAIQAWIGSQSGAAQKGVSGTRMVRRTGPIVVYFAGQVSPGQARSLLDTVNYDANVTWNEPTFLGKRNNVGSLVVAAMALAGIILLIALAAGLAFGGVRVVLKRWLPDRVFDRSADVEIIRLKLEE